MDCTSNGSLKTVTQAKADLLECARESHNSWITEHPGAAMATSFGAGLAAARLLHRPKKRAAAQHRTALARGLVSSFILAFANKFAQAMLAGVVRGLSANRRIKARLSTSTPVQEPENSFVDDQC
jgi:hypothetical protein